MPTPSTQSGGAVPAQLAMHAAHKAREARLFGATAPLAKPPRQRPVSPFVREVQERAISQREALERRMAANRGLLGGQPPEPSQAAGLWPAYAVPVVYDHCEGSGPARITMRQIIKETAEKHGVTVFDITSIRRNRDVVAARQESMWRCKMETSHSLPAIGRAHGGRDHTTVLHSVRRQEERMREAAQQ